MTRVLVYPHSMEIGGSQLNAIDLARQYCLNGHDVTILAEPGPLVRQVLDSGLELIEIPLSRRRPSVDVVKQIRALVRTRGIGVIHAFEWPPIVEACWAMGIDQRALVTGTIMSMSVAPFLPRTLPLTLGTEELLERAQAIGFERAILLEPPVDTEANAPGLGRVPPSHQLPPPLPGVLDLVMVSRLAPELKAEGIREAIEVTGKIGGARFILVGDGPLRGHFERLAAEVNRDLGRDAVILCGAMQDPRPAYARADVVLGMGGSALKGLAFGKPVIVAGESGFWRLADRATMSGFSRTGWFGRGAGTSGASDLITILSSLIEDSERRRQLGLLGREFVVSHYSLESAAQRMEGWWGELAQEPPRAVWPTLKVLPSLFRYKAERKAKRWVGRAATDDFNSPNLRRSYESEPGEGRRTGIGSPS